MWECMLCVSEYLQSPEEGSGSPGTGVKCCYELSDMGSQTLEEQHMLSTAKPFLQN